MYNNRLNRLIVQKSNSENNQTQSMKAPPGSQPQATGGIAPPWSAGTKSLFPTKPRIIFSASVVLLQRRLNFPAPDIRVPTQQFWAQRLM